MSDVQITGLRADDLFQFRATCGLLQVLSEIQDWGGTTLRWDGCTPVLGIQQTREELVVVLDHLYATRAEDPRWWWPRDPASPHRGTVDDYRTALRAFADHPSRLAWVRGTATDQVIQKNAKGLWVTGRTLFEFKKGGGHKSIFLTTRKTMQQLGEIEDRQGCIAEALFEGRALHDIDHHMNWIAEQTMPTAYLGASIENFPKTASLFHLALVFESLAMFPVHGRGGYSTTVGFSSDGRAFSWGTWSRPLTRDAVQRVLDYSELHREEPDVGKLGDVGFTAVYRAGCVQTSNKKDTLFTRPHLLFSEK